VAEADSPGPLARIAAAARAQLGVAGFDEGEMEAAGQPLTYWKGGTGPDLLLLHGAGQQAGSWVAVAPGLTDRHTVHVLDLPGHGDSGPTEGDLPFARIVVGLEAYLLSLDLPPEKPAVLVGSSMGAWLATLMAHRHPERVGRIVLVNGGALLNVPAEGLTLTPPDRETARRTMAALRDPSSPPLSDELLDDIVRRSRVGPVGRMMKDLPGLMAHLLEGRLGEVTVPVDLLWGESDGLMPLSYARRMESQLPRVRLTVLERCGHIPPSECPERFLEALHEVLSQDPPVAKTAPAEGSPKGEPSESKGEPPAEEPAVHAVHLVHSAHSGGDSPR